MTAKEFERKELQILRFAFRFCAPRPLQTLSSHRIVFPERREQRGKSIEHPVRYAIRIINYENVFCSFEIFSASRRQFFASRRVALRKFSRRGFRDFIFSAQRNRKRRNRELAGPEQSEKE